MSYLYNHHGKIQTRDHEMRTDAGPNTTFWVVYALVVAIIDRFTFISEVKVYTIICWKKNPIRLTSAKDGFSQTYGFWSLLLGENFPSYNLIS